MRCAAPAHHRGHLRTTYRGAAEALAGPTPALSVFYVPCPHRRLPCPCPSASACACLHLPAPACACMHPAPACTCLRLPAPCTCLHLPAPACACLRLHAPCAYLCLPAPTPSLLRACPACALRMPCPCSAPRSWGAFFITVIPRGRLQGWTCRAVAIEDPGGMLPRCVRRVSLDGRLPREVSRGDSRRVVWQPRRRPLAGRVRKGAVRGSCGQRRNSLGREKGGGKKEASAFA